MGLRSEPRLTLEDFLALCEAAPEGVRYEAVGGRAVRMASPVGPHQVAVAEVWAALRAAAAPGLRVLPSPLDWVLWQRPSLTVRQPDLVMVTDEQARGDRLTSPPLLVVEVVSPTTRREDVVVKRREYARAGAPHYWIVDVVDAGAPSVEALALDPALDDYRVSAKAFGADPLVVADPFPVRLTPADLTV